jgi:hypothetical protein
MKFTARKNSSLLDWEAYKEAYIKGRIDVVSKIPGQVADRWGS